tara:strand:- start:588 stop:917 length:330 start_codon:yes stop_codon:yes gene_type:complete
MAITYTYKINRILTAPAIDDLTDVITEVEYTYTGSEGTGDNKVTAAIDAVAILGDPDPSNFTAFNELTEANVREFVKAVVDVEWNKQLVQDAMAEKRVPKNVEKALPWA